MVRDMRRSVVLVALWLVTFSCHQSNVSLAAAQNASAGEKNAIVATTPDPDINIGEIEFFGYQSSGLDMQSVRSALPVHEGQVLTMADFNAVRPKINDSVQRISDHPITDIAAVCCDPKGHFMVYIGLGANQTTMFSYNPTPGGKMRLPESAIKLDQQATDASMKAVMKGASGEDYSKGYSLLYDPDTRKYQLAIREWALHHESILREVLSMSSSAQHRQAAARFLGYAQQSQRQIDALAKAANDPDAAVRNNAVRALMVLAESNSQLAAKIPADNFVALLNSGSWTDRNKAGLLLVTLTEKRDPKLLEQLRTETLDSLVEMARWRDLGHAISYRIILGRIAGIDETHVEKIAEKSDQVEELIAEAKKTMSLK
jgi:hypothetical protein